MPEKETKRVAITISRTRRGETNIIVATGFKLRVDKATGLLDVYLEAAAQKNQRVSLDTSLLQTNLSGLKQYVAGVAVNEDDAAVKEDIAISEIARFANMVHCSHMGPRAETIFGVFSIGEWVEATRSADEKNRTVTSVDTLVAISTLALQKKLMLDLVTLIAQQSSKQ